MSDTTTPYTSIDHDIFVTVQEQIERDTQVKEVRSDLQSVAGLSKD